MSALERMELQAAVRLWSVTTLIKRGMGNSDQLMGWNSKVTATSAVRSRNTWMRMIEDEGEQAAIDWLKSARWRETKRAQLRGTELHRHAEQLALGVRPTDVDALVMPYVEQLARWIVSHEPQWVMAEAPVYNVEQGYAGTLDGVVDVHQQRVLYDIKTTAHGPSHENRPPFPEVALQLAAYRNATEVGVLAEKRTDGRGERFYIYDPDATHQPMPEVDGAMCVVVSPYDCFAKEVRVTPDVFRTFLHVYQAALFRERGTYDLFGPELVPAREQVA